MAEVKDLLGKTLLKADVGKEEIIFLTSDGDRYKMYHGQDCCECVEVEDVIGDIQDLVGAPLLMAEEIRHENDNPEGAPTKEYQESFTWTFYKFATINGYVTIRWYGESNGYYSESVDFEKM